MALRACRSRGGEASRIGADGVDRDKRTISLRGFRGKDPLGLAVFLKSVEGRICRICRIAAFHHRSGTAKVRCLAMAAHSATAGGVSVAIGVSAIVGDAFAAVERPAPSKEGRAGRGSPPRESVTGISGRLASSSGAMARATRPHSCPTTCWRCGSETKRERQVRSAQATQTWGVLHWPSQSVLRHPIRASEQ
jgi:hypothetical protein